MALTLSVAPTRGSAEVKYVKVCNYVNVNYDLDIMR